MFRDGLYGDGRSADLVRTTVRKALASRADMTSSSSRFRDSIHALQTYIELTLVAWVFHEEGNQLGELCKRTSGIAITSITRSDWPLAELIRSLPLTGSSEVAIAGNSGFEA